VDFIITLLKVLMRKQNDILHEQKGIKARLNTIEDKVIIIEEKMSTAAATELETELASIKRNFLLKTMEDFWAFDKTLSENDPLVDRLVSNINGRG